MVLRLCSQQSLRHPSHRLTEPPRPPRSRRSRGGRRTMCRRPIRRVRACRAIRSQADAHPIRTPSRVRHRRCGCVAGGSSIVRGCAHAQGNPRICARSSTPPAPRGRRSIPPRRSAGPQQVRRRPPVRWRYRVRPSAPVRPMRRFARIRPVANRRTHPADGACRAARAPIRVGWSPSCPAPPSDHGHRRTVRRRTAR